MKMICDSVENNLFLAILFTHNQISTKCVRKWVKNLKKKKLDSAISACILQCIISKASGEDWKKRSGINCSTAGTKRTDFACF